jgi:hypothetical protein
VIRPELAKAPGAPKAVREAYESWHIFKTASQQDVFDGFWVIQVSHETLTRDFLKRLLIRGGTDRDIRWLVNNNVMSAADIHVWDSVVDEYASTAIEEIEDAE